MKRGELVNELVSRSVSASVKITAPVTTPSVSTSWGVKIATTSAMYMLLSSRCKRTKKTKKSGPNLPNLQQIHDNNKILLLVCNRELNVMNEASSNKC